MDQIDIAVHGVVHSSPDSAKQIASKLGMSYQVLVNKVNPNNETHKLTLREVVAIMLITDDVRILKAMGSELGCSVERRSDCPARDVMEAALNASIEHNDVQQAILKGMQDKRLSEREKAGILLQVHEAREALDHVERSVVEFGS